MLWSGIVYRNSNFSKDGTIDVMLPQKYHSNGLSRVYDGEIDTIKNIKSVLGMEKNGAAIFGGGTLTVKCLVLSGNGNGKNSGIFSIPQIGTRGLVAEIGDKVRFNNVYYVWLGGLYGDLEGGKDIEIPSDDTINDDIEDVEKDENGDLDLHGYISTNSINNSIDEIKESEYISKGAYVIKTKTNNISDYENIDFNKLKWQNILPENTFIMSQDKAVLRHDINDYDKNQKIGIEQLFIDSSRVDLKRKIKKDDKILEQDLVMDDNKIAITLNNEKDDSKITINLSVDGTVNITTTGDLKVSAEKNINFEADGDIGIKSGGKIDMKSDKKTIFVANGVNLGEQVDNLAQAVNTLTTKGSPAYQAVDVPTISRGRNVSTNINNGFNGF